MSAAAEKVMEFNGEEISPIAAAAIHRNVWIAAVDKEIDRCWPWLEDAMVHGFPAGIISHTKDDIKEMVISNEAQLWSTPNGACLTCVTQYPRVSIVQIWLMGGDFEELMTKHEHAVYQWAKSIGASLVYVQGRRGWTRRLKSRGYKEHQAITCMELTNGRTSTGQ